MTYRDVCRKKNLNDQLISENAPDFNMDVDLDTLSVAESGVEEGDSFVAYDLDEFRVLVVFENKSDRIEFVNEDGFIHGTFELVERSQTK